MAHSHRFRYSALVIISLALTIGLSIHPIRADQPEFRRIELPDLGSFDYPIVSYSVQAVVPDISEARRSEILFPGVFQVTPNDQFLYTEQNRGNVVYTFMLSAVANTQTVTPGALKTQLGKLPLLSDDSLSTLPAKSITLDGLPAIRIDDIPLGKTARATYILVHRGPTLVELLIKPAIRYGAPHHNEFVVGNVHPNRAIIEQVISSLRFVK